MGNQRLKTAMAYVFICVSIIHIYLYSTVAIQDDDVLLLLSFIGGVLYCDTFIICEGVDEVATFAYVAFSSHVFITTHKNN